MRVRVVQDEVLDGLAPDDPAAQRSRIDLQRIHRVMGTRSLLTRALHRLLPSPPRAARLRVLELGAGDGTLMLGVARRLAPQWPEVSLRLLDRQPLLAPSTTAAYAALGWRAQADIADVADWARRPPPEQSDDDQWDLIVANLFLHHFAEQPLTALLRAIAARADRFVAIEPRRARLALVASHLVGVLGANAVTREDAVLSVRAGFRDSELSGLWEAAPARWRVAEHAAGLFSHVFTAERRQRAAA